MFCLLILAALTSRVVAQQPSVTIKNGTVRGVDLPQFNQSIFFGIPYAQPPVGDLRLEPPRSINASFGTIDAIAYGPHCWSKFTTGFDDNSGFNNSEDCLTLNVIRPAGVSEKSPVPVVVWIHGGGLISFLTTGGSGDFRYNGSWIVESSIANGKPIVFLSLASLDFLGGKALKSVGSLNFGLRDQRLALHWVQENIAQAGASSVHAHIVAYGGRDDKLFNQAIAESGSGGNYTAGDSPTFQVTYDAFLANTTCAWTANSSVATQLSCLKSLPIDEFRESSVNAETGIVFDGDLINVPGTFQAYKSGKWVKVAFLTGSNSDEGRSFAHGRPVGFVPRRPLPGGPYHTGTFQLDPVQNGLFFTPGLQNKRVAAIVGDMRQAPGPRLIAQTTSSEVPFYKYRTDFWITNHFTATYLGPAAPIEDRFLGIYMSRAWASFIATGDPNNANVSSKITWPSSLSTFRELPSGNNFSNFKFCVPFFFGRNDLPTLTTLGVAVAVLKKWWSLCRSSVEL
ncbi:Alpha/Beta hydrolase protein [Mycena metata]|uniref:Alpha/Beta hydrolase protein n=1 Tax=Mycena metata TaxID=1033252 RepID=A0AAD7JI71_9AGAR|nr:Alpha/Beta hydrolase protein [Mycena metata]